MTSESRLAACINVVVAQPVVAVQGAGGPSLGQGPVGLAGGGALHCPVRAVLVAVLAEGAGLALQVRPDGGSWGNQLANVACDRRGCGRVWQPQTGVHLLGRSGESRCAYLLTVFYWWH